MGHCAGSEAALQVPLTFAHPAVVLPLVRPMGRFGVLSALVCGSVAPDLPYFTGNMISRHESHSLGGLLWYCLPAGIACHVLFWLLLKDALVSLLPWPATVGAEQRVRGARAAGPGRWLAVPLCVLVGAITHLAWDAFTHEGGAVVAAIPALKHELFVVGGYRVYVFKVLQHGSTLAGLAYLARRAWCAWSRSLDQQQAAASSAGHRLAISGVLVALAVLAAMAAGIAAVARSGGVEGPLQLFLGTAVIAGTQVLFCGLLVYAVMRRFGAVR